MKIKIFSLHNIFRLLSFPCRLEKNVVYSFVVLKQFTYLSYNCFRLSLFATNLYDNKYGGMNQKQKLERLLRERAGNGMSRNVQAQAPLVSSYGNEYHGMSLKQMKERCEKNNIVIARNNAILEKQRKERQNIEKPNDEWRELLKYWEELDKKLARDTYEQETCERKKEQLVLEAQEQEKKLSELQQKLEAGDDESDTDSSFDRAGNGTRRNVQAPLISSYEGMNQNQL